MDQYNSRQQTIVAHCSDNNRRGLEVLSVKLTPQDFIGNPATTGIPQGQDANITYYDVSVATAGVPRKSGHSRHFLTSFCYSFWNGNTTSLKNRGYIFPSISNRYLLYIGI
jgi:hypothetical protein